MSRHASHGEDVVRHYDSLFIFPSHTRIIVYLYTACILIGILPFILTIPSYTNAIIGVIFGLTLATCSLMADLITWTFLTKDDPILNLRRLSALSLLACFLWIVIITIGSILSRFFALHLITSYSALLGFSAVFSLRFLVIYAVSSLQKFTKLVASILQPLICFSAITIFWTNLIMARSLAVLIATSTILVMAAFSFSKIIDRFGERNVGTGAVTLFRAFIADWISDVNTPLESFLEKNSSLGDINVTTLAFRKDEKLRAIMVIPAFHPGPFKNVGSSALPFRIQETLEKEKNAVVCVPHGTSGHELDVASQAECEKIIQTTLKLSTFTNFAAYATKMVRAEVNSAKATCQIFGNCALLTLTSAPKGMEDIPQETGIEISNQSKRAGLDSAAVIDAHNSFKDDVSSLSTDDVSNLQKAAEQALSLALKEPREKFNVGVAKIVPKGISIIQGMGPGGIVVFAVKTGIQTSAYAVIDGNNMVSGLREKILEGLKTIGINEGEVLTTDTHMVNGIILGGKGYHPLGEAIDHRKLVEHVTEVANHALLDMNESEASWNQGQAHQVKVIGSKHLGSISSLINSTIKLARKMALVIFSIAIVLSVIISIVLLS